MCTSCWLYNSIPWNPSPNNSSLYFAVYFPYSAQVSTLYLTFLFLEGGSKHVYLGSDPLRVMNLDTGVYVLQKWACVAGEPEDLVG